MKTSRWKGWILLGFVVITVGCVGQWMEKRKTHPLEETWEHPVPFQEVPQGLSSLQAKDCGVCHQKIYQEWKASPHGVAFIDPQFQAEWKKDQSLWLCLDCHAPLVNQQPTLVSGKKGGDYHRPVQKTNPHFDRALQKEGITCAVCHVRNGTVIGPFGNTNAPHPVKKDLSQLSVDSCLKCHNASADLTDTLVCRFTTGEEWRSSSYPARGQDCVTCHMPEVKRPLVNTEGFSQRKVRRHSWRGSGIAKFLGQEEEAKDFYMSGFNIRIETPKTAYDAEEMVKASIRLKNAYAGHFLPTGDVEYFYIINMNARDEEDRIIAEKKERVGQLWKWYPKAEKVSDNSYRPFEERTYSLDFSFPKLSDRVKLEVAIQTHRMTKENAQTMGLLGGYPISAQTNRKQLVLHKRKP